MHRTERYGNRIHPIGAPRLRPSAINPWLDRSPRPGALRESARQGGGAGSSATRRLASAAKVFLSEVGRSSSRTVMPVINLLQTTLRVSALAVILAEGAVSQGPERPSWQEIGIPGGLRSVSRIAFAADGSMAIQSATEGKLLFLDQAGGDLGIMLLEDLEPLTQLGRGHFWEDGRFVILDKTGARAIAVEPRSGSSTEVSFGEAAFEPPLRPAPPLAVLPDGSTVVQASATIEALAAGQVTSRPLVVVAPDGSTRRSLYSRRSTGTGLSVESGGATTQMMQPFRSDPLVAVSPLGDYVLVVERDQVETPSIKVRWIPTSGGAPSEVEVPVPRRPLRAEELEDWLEREEPAAFAEPASREAWLAALARPAFSAPVDRVLPGVGRTALVRLSVSGDGEGDCWLLASPEGMAWREICVPLGLDIRAFSGRTAVGTMRAPAGRISLWRTDLR